MNITTFGRGGDCALGAVNASTTKATQLRRSVRNRSSGIREAVDRYDVFCLPSAYTRSRHGHRGQPRRGSDAIPPRHPAGHRSPTNPAWSRVLAPHVDADDAPGASGVLSGLARHRSDARNFVGCLESRFLVTSREGARNLAELGGKSPLRRFARLTLALSRAVSSVVAPAAAAPC